MKLATIRQIAPGLAVLLLGCASETAPTVAPTPLGIGESIQLAVITGPAANLNEADGVGWKEVTEYVVDTMWAPPVHPSVNLRHDATAPTESVKFRIARDDSRLYVLMRWSDASHDHSNSFDKFADAAAVQFALGGGGNTPYTMGAPNMPVNIWYWRAGESTAQDLAAGGFGSTSRVDSTDLDATGRYVGTDSGEWTVVFSRALNAGGEYQASFDAGADINVALAVWQGSDSQRDGLKRTTVGWVTVNTADVLAAAQE